MRASGGTLTPALPPTLREVDWSASAGWLERGASAGNWHGVAIVSESGKRGACGIRGMGEFSSGRSLDEQQPRLRSEGIRAVVVGLLMLEKRYRGLLVERRSVRRRC